MPVPPPPRFLQAFYDSLGQDALGWTADCPICTCEGMTIRPEQERGMWVFGCQDGCPHEEIVNWLQVDVRLWADQEREEAIRGWMCMMLAPTVEIYQALLAGEPVAEHMLDQKWLRRFDPIGAVGEHGHDQRGEE